MDYWKKKKCRAGTWPSVVVWMKAGLNVSVQLIEERVKQTGISSKDILIKKCLK